jgi:ethanolamine ammonia-lyase small subunit
MEDEFVIDIYTKPPRTHFRTIVEFLKKKGVAQTTNQIVVGTGLSLRAVSQVIHRTHKTWFVANKIEGYSRTKAWTLAPE